MSVAFTSSATVVYNDFNASITVCLIFAAHKFDIVDLSCNEGFVTGFVKRSYYRVLHLEIEFLLGSANTSCLL